jgi:hypothetical protein
VAFEEKKGYVSHGLLQKDVLSSLLKERFDRACAIVRKVDNAEVVLFPSPEVESLPGDWTEGQIFNEKAELRWRIVPDGCRVLLLAEENNPLTGFQILNGSPFSVVSPSKDNKHGFMLWGTRPDQDKWWETRIPRPLRYPCNAKNKLLTEKDKPPRLVYRLYLEGSAVRWVRLVKLEEVK